jgi:hypothetical protein
MDLSAGPLIASLLIGTIGFGLFLYGKKAQRMPQLVSGLALMVYPYFVPGLGWMIGVGVLVIAALLAAVRYGL